VPRRAARTTHDAHGAAVEGEATPTPVASSDLRQGTVLQDAAHLLRLLFDHTSKSQRARALQARPGHALRPLPERVIALVQELVLLHDWQADPATLCAGLQMLNSVCCTSRLAREALVQSHGAIVALQRLPRTTRERPRVVAAA